MIGDERKREARAYVAGFRIKHGQDPYGYPLSWLIRNLLLNEISYNSPTPVGPGTRAHTVRLAEQKNDEEINGN